MPGLSMSNPPFFNTYNCLCVVTCMPLSEKALISPVFILSLPMNILIIDDLPTPDEPIKQYVIPLTIESLKSSIPIPLITLVAYISVSTNRSLNAEILDSHSSSLSMSALFNISTGLMPPAFAMER